MSNTTQKEALKTQFMAANRNLTLGILAALIICSAGLWAAGVVVQGINSVMTGLVLIALAVVFYKLPHISYLLVRKNHQETMRSIDPKLAEDWLAFKKWLEQSY